MTELIDPSEVERLVGAYRHPTAHLCRADSFHEATYLLHSKACLDSGIDLRTCEYALAQDNGIDTDVWEGREDMPVQVAIVDARLVPLKRVPGIVVCTGLTAAWCPIHGDCVCDREQSMDHPDCPLHAPESPHAE